MSNKKDADSNLQIDSNHDKMTNKLPTYGRIDTKVDKLEEDLLDFEKDIRGFKKLISTVNPKFVVTVEAPWGSGKSTFLRILEAEIETDDSVIKINAWESDYSNNPIATILSGILDSELSKDNGQLIEEILKIGARFTKTLLPIAVKMITGGILDSKGLENFSLDEFMEAATSTMVEEFKGQKEDLELLKEKLGELVDKTEEKKIIFLIDELDRCRPNYALEFLEAVKHLFNVQGIVFVLAIEDKVLAGQMKQVYGQDFDSNEYLKKFIDIRYKLNPRITYNFVEARFTEFGLDDMLGENISYSPQVDSDVYKNMMYMMAHLYELSPRDLNQVVTKFILILVKADRAKISVFAVLFILLLEQKSRDLVKIYMDDELSDLYDKNPHKNWVPFTHFLKFHETNDKIKDGEAVEIVANLIVYKASDSGLILNDFLDLFSFDHDRDHDKKLSSIQNTEKWLIESIHQLSINSHPQDLLQNSAKAVFHTEL